MTARPLSTGEVARRADVGKQTVRYYERRGLLPEPLRNGAGHRQYDTEAVRRLRFISSSGVRRNWASRSTPSASCSRYAPAPGHPTARSNARPKKNSTKRAHLADLRRIETSLENLYEACDGEGTPREGPLLEALEEDDRHSG